MRIEESVEIDRPPEEVFAYVADPEHLPEWSGIVQEVRKEGQGQPREGDRFTTAAKFLGRRFETPMEVVAHEPPRRHSDRSTGGPFEQEHTFIVEATDPTTGRPTTFTLRRAGSSTTVAAIVTYNATTRTATLNPNANLRRGATYIATVRIGARDLAGNALDQNPNTGGNQPKTWRFTVRT
jgi:uncharacterized protein YndB with AHSA1/START domain